MKRNGISGTRLQKINISENRDKSFVFPSRSRAHTPAPGCVNISPPRLPRSRTCLLPAASCLESPFVLSQKRAVIRVCRALMEQIKNNRHPGNNSESFYAAVLTNKSADATTVRREGHRRAGLSAPHSRSIKTSKNTNK